MSDAGFFDFVFTAGSHYSRVLSAPVVAHDTAPRPALRRRSVRTWEDHVDLSQIAEEVAALPQFFGPSPDAVRAVLIAPGVDAPLHRRFADVYGSAPSYVCFAMDAVTFGGLTEDEYVELHFGLGHATQTLWLALMRRGFGCVPFGRIEGGRLHDLAGSGLRPLFTLAVGVPRNPADAP